MRLATFVLLAVVVAAPAGLTSRWRTEAVTVDGLSAEWQAPELLDRGVTVGAVNDGEFLYLVVSAKDPESIAYLSTGLIVWLDPGGRRAETFGLRIAGVEQPVLPGMTPIAPAAGPAGISTTVLDRFDVLGPGKNQRRLVDLNPELGIEIASSRAETEVAYELKIPLQKTSSRTYAVGVAPGRTDRSRDCHSGSAGRSRTTPSTGRRLRLHWWRPLVRRRLREIPRGRRQEETARNLDDDVARIRPLIQNPGGTRRFEACSNAYASAMRRGSAHASPVKLTPNGAGFASNPAGNAAVGALGTTPAGTMIVG